MKFTFLSDVLFGNDHALDTLCNEPYDKCTIASFLDYLGHKNPNLPFQIDFTPINDTESSEKYYNQTTFQCQEAVATQYENKSACSCSVS